MAQTYNLGKVSITPKGTYNASATYNALDIVTYNGSGYIVLQTVSGVTPPNITYYQLIASKGESGASGQSPTIEVGNVTTGDTLSVSNVGTPVNAVFDFVIPDASNPPLTITIDYESSPNKLDKTYSEIQAAVQAGKTIIINANMYEAVPVSGSFPFFLTIIENNYVFSYWSFDNIASVFNSTSENGTMVRA